MLSGMLILLGTRAPPLVKAAVTLRAEVSPTLSEPTVQLVEHLRCPRGTMVLANGKVDTRASQNLHQRVKGVDLPPLALAQVAWPID